MNIIRGLSQLQRAEPGLVLTIGNFDGVHLGHQAVIDQVLGQAQSAGMKAAVMTFDPQPREYFDNEADIPPRLTRFREKVDLLKQGGAIDLICMPFNERLAQMPAEDFVKEVLVDALNVRYIVVGDDFRFGQGRKGDFALLEKLGKVHDFDVLNTPTLDYQGRRVSSTRIRKALVKDDLGLANALLGRTYSISGRVAHGDKRGRIIGFPTANVFLHRDASPVKGVYAIKCHGIHDEPVLGVANVGTRPTVGGKRKLLEVHLFDFNDEIYGREVNVAFHHKIRDEKKFESFELLKAQILKDADSAKKYFANDSEHTE